MTGRMSSRRARTVAVVVTVASVGVVGFGLPLYAPLGWAAFVVGSGLSAAAWVRYFDRRDAERAAAKRRHPVSYRPGQASVDGAWRVQPGWEQPPPTCEIRADVTNTVPRQRHDNDGGRWAS